MPAKRYKYVPAIYICTINDGKRYSYVPYVLLSQETTEIRAEVSTTSEGTKYYEKQREKVKFRAMERKTAGISGQRVRAGHCQHKARILCSQSNGAREISMLTLIENSTP
jgi:hypothetical protein